MKIGSPHSNTKKGIPRTYKCEFYGKPYAVEWAKINHQKNCQEKNSK